MSDFDDSLNGLLHAFSNCGAIELRTSVEVCAEVACVVGNCDVGVGGAPNVIAKVASGASVSREGGGLLRRKLGAHVVYVGVGILECCAEIELMFRPFGEQQYVVSQNPWNDAKKSGLDNPWS